MQLTENEILVIIDRLRCLNVACWELVGLVPAKGNTAVINVIEAIVSSESLYKSRPQIGHSLLGSFGIRRCRETRSTMSWVYFTASRFR